MASAEKKGSLLATEPFILLNAISVGTYRFLVSHLTVDKVCHRIYNSTVCRKLSSGLYPHQEKVVYAEATTWNSIIFGAVTVMSSLTILLIGALSDLVSKKKLLLVIPVIITLQTIILMLASYFMSSSLVFVVIAAGLPSVFGDVYGALMLAFSYIADVTDADQKRTLRMNVLEAIKVVSSGFASFLTGILLKNFGYIVAFSLSLSASLTNIIFVAFFLPEIKVSEKLEDDELVKGEFDGVWGHLKKSLLGIIYFVNKYLLSWKRKHVGLLLLATFLTYSADLGDIAVRVLFFQHAPLALSMEQIGEFLLLQHCVSCVGVVIIAICNVKLVKPPDICLLVIGQLSMVSAFIGLGLSTDWPTLLGVTPLGFAFSLAAAGLRSMLTKEVEPNEHGTVLAFLELLCLFGMVFASFLCDYVFRLTAWFFPGLAILLLALFCAVGILLAVAAFFCSKSDGKMSSEDQKEHEAIPLLDTGNAKAE